ncbi:hypothetical protein Acsp01_16710 [Actinoplanes sp. NBRC 101535]|nr:hypothetical protein Acsp01_16710 [Actinoplanes sp. NBRC 101535]
MVGGALSDSGKGEEAGNGAVGCVGSNGDEVGSDMSSEFLVDRRPMLPGTSRAGYPSALIGSESSRDVSGRTSSIVGP